MIKQMVVGFLLELDATLDGECRFLELWLSLKVVKGLQECFKTLMMDYKSLRLPIIVQVKHGAMVMAVGSKSGKSQFETYG